MLVEHVGHIAGECGSALAEIEGVACAKVHRAAHGTLIWCYDIHRLAEAEVKNVSLTNFDAIAEIAAQEGYIAETDVERLIAFRNNPSDESWIGGK